MKARILHGDCLDHMKALADAGELFDGCVTDPPYHLTSIVKRFGKAGSAAAQHGTDGAFARTSRGFMSKEWDGGDVAFRPETWRLVFDVLKPGAHLLAFGGTRTYHRMVCAIEDAGFEIRDRKLFIHDSAEDAERFLGSLNEEQQAAFIKMIESAPGELAWIYGSGMNKRGYLSYLLEASLCEKVDGQNIYRDTGSPMRRQPPFRHEQADRLWGWAGAVKPAFEPIVVARKPLDGTEVTNMLAHGVGVLNIDACRVPTNDKINVPSTAGMLGGASDGWDRPWKSDVGAVAARVARALEAIERTETLGRHPANVLHDGSPEVLEAFGRFAAPGQSGAVTGNEPSAKTNAVYGQFGGRPPSEPRGDGGSPARFFFSAKAGPDDHFGSKHPTVKPVALIKWLADLILPQGARLIDPFAGTGPIVFARPDLDMTLIEREDEYVADIRRRIAHVEGGGMLRSQEIARRKAAEAAPLPEDGLFGWSGDAA